MTNYYSLLGVSKDCSETDLKRAYRKLAKKYHPDVNKEKQAEEKFKEIQTAYEVLKDKEKRNLYDSYGENWHKVQQSGFDNQNSDFSKFSQQGSQSFSFDNLGDIFTDLFNQNHQNQSFNNHQPKTKKGEDINVSLPLTVEDAIKGGKRNISYSYQKLANTNLEYKSIDINIPAAIGNGKKLRVKGKGSPGSGINPIAGDLYVKIQIVEHKNYKVNNNDIYEHINVAPWEAALGTTLQIDTPFGEKKIKVPEGTQSGSKIRIKGKGLDGGDFYIVYDVKLPLADTHERKEFYKQMKEKLNFNPRC